MFICTPLIYARSKSSDSDTSDKTDKKEFEQQHFFNRRITYEWMNSLSKVCFKIVTSFCTLVRLNYIHIYRFAHANNTYLLSYHVRVCIYKIYIGIIEDILCQRFKQRTKRIMLRATTEHHVQHIGVAIEREP